MRKGQWPKGGTVSANIVDAFVWNGSYDNTFISPITVLAFINKTLTDNKDGTLTIKLDNGNKAAVPGDYIVYDSEGDWTFDSYSPDAFEKTYKAIGNGYKRR